jgi:hypothetical protein
MAPRPTVTGAIPLRERLTLGDQWADFERRVLPASVGKIQRQEMRRAWYAGAATLFSLMAGGLDADHEPTDLDVAYLDSLNGELAAFAESVRAGRA